CCRLQICNTDRLRNWQRQPIRDVRVEAMIELVSENRAVAYRDLRYLVVDDDDDQRFLLVRTLNRMGMANVVEAASGRAALEVLAGSKQTIDIVISDLQMPDVDGMELVR